MLPVLLFALAVVIPHADVAGNWRVEFVTASQGEVGVTMTINQADAKLTGHVVNEDGEFELQGTIDGDQITIVWTVPEQGKPMQITMRGTVKGEFISGVARLGNAGEGDLEARRVSRNR